MNASHGNAESERKKKKNDSRKWEQTGVGGCELSSGAGPKQPAGQQQH